MLASHLIILLHGIGASGQQLAPLAPSWNGRLPNAVFATPDAPYRNGYGGHQWFKVDGMQLDPGRIRDAREGFDRKMRDVIAQEGFADRLRDVAFVGVSQGAIMALDGVASGRWSVGAVVAFSGLLPPTSILPESNQTPVLLVHGADDRTIPSVASTVAARQLRAAGFLVELEIEPRVGHTISVSGADTAVGFLRKVLAR
ncbi:MULTISPECIES: alpha/beta hydrolase [unclassified Rhizobium]|uniref:alpha/beta hydrolase n=1 Tax=unclassified Rhizobium TaxID=2613769 RepID=UPI00177C13A9|nr:MULTISPECIES: dienelactone hydrolase family protein [unclassified Rhizobium]MBD8687206.1 dienelactone hydrolase family protein [Rhizobium sp. CFBP 13644]MBD8690991.1 dienelactone hydrolase family protein [Rhizobium sp. CFBP 13717]